MNAAEVPYQLLVVCKRCGLKGEADVEPEIVEDAFHKTIRLVLWVNVKCPRCDWPGGTRD